MRTTALPLATAVLLATMILPLAGCSRPGEPGAVQAGKDANGDPTIHIDSDKVNRNLDQAGREVKRQAQDLGKAVQEGARKADEKVGPVVREVLDDAGITAKVKAKLLADPEVKSTQIFVDTVDGRVTLNGQVGSADQRAT